MTPIATAAAYLSGLGLVAPDLAPPALLGTALALHICDAILCRLFAHNNGYPKNLWTLLGLSAGLWAVAVLVLLPRRDGAPPRARPRP
jgi:hypothetical protein